ncbi:MAG TPA: hypothetical protein VEC19_08835 [Usitatibacter sp.]|nr:hypothetical protein [Usitatibacter sp.]
MPVTETQPPQASTLNWRDLLARCDSEEAIISVTREYLASWNPEELAMLPEACRPGRIRDGEDITQWAFELASAHCASGHDPAADPLLVKMLVFLTEAGRCLAAVKPSSAPQSA